MTLYARYVAGEHRAVWDELVRAGPGVRTPPMLDEAQLVVRETMRIVRANIETLIRELEKRRFQFGRYPDGEDVPGYDGPLVRPDDDIEEHIAELEALCGGPVPLSLAGFWRHVGTVSLVGYHPEWPNLCADPLWVESPEGAISEFDDWVEWRKSDPDLPFGAPIAPDALHKDNVSGDEPYVITLPDPAADAILRNEGNDLYFVEYLRQAMDWGGFPGFASDPDAMPRWLVALRGSGQRF